MSKFSIKQFVVFIFCVRVEVHQLRNYFFTLQVVLYSERNFMLQANLCQP